MEFSEWFNQQLVHFFVNPGHKEKVISFSSSIRNSKTVLISYTAEENVQPGTLLKFVELLPKSEFTILIKDQTGTYLHPWLSGAGPLILTLPHDLCHPTYWNVVHSDFVQNLTSRSFDTYIDLDPEYNLLGPYLCRKLRPAIRIGFSKPYSEPYYNIQYQLGTDQSYEVHLKGFLKFLKKLLQK